MGICYSDIFDQDDTILFSYINILQAYYCLYFALVMILSQYLGTKYKKSYLTISNIIVSYEIRVANII